MSYFSEKMSARPRTSYAGVIRPGIRRLTRAAQEHPRSAEIRAIFNRADQGEMRFEEAQKAIEKQTGLANSMHPSNAPYFSVFATDFTVPEHARLLMEKYGEDRGDGRRLYRFPVVFPTVDIDRILPGGFKRSKGEPGYFSTQGLDGVRYCTYYEHITPEQIQEQRRQRIIQVRPAPKIRGQCDPGKCREFTEGSCRFVGELNFYIPGVPVGGLLKLTTGSEHASEAIYMELARIKEVLGTIPQIHPFDPGTPPFMITKELQPRTYYDPRTGERKRAENWVPILVPTFDMGALISGAQPLLERKMTPQAWLAASPSSEVQSARESHVSVHEPAVDVMHESSGPDQPEFEDRANMQSVSYEQLIDRGGREDPPLQEEPMNPLADLSLNDLVDVTKPNVAAWVEALGGPDKAVQVARSLAGLGDGVLESHIAISEMVRSSGISSDQFRSYMTQRYGKGWVRNASVYSDALTNLRAMHADGSLRQIIAAASQT